MSDSVREIICRTKCRHYLATMKARAWGPWMFVFFGVLVSVSANEVLTLDLQASGDSGAVEGRFVIHQSQSPPKLEFALSLWRVDTPGSSPLLSLVRTNPANPATWEMVRDWSIAEPHETREDGCTRDGPPPSSCGKHGYLPITAELVALLQAGQVFLRLQENGPFHQSDIVARLIPVSEAGRIAVTEVRFDFLPTLAIDHLVVRYEGISPRIYQLWASPDLLEWTLIARDTSYNGGGSFSVKRSELGDFRFFKVGYDPTEQTAVIEN